ncbi:MAG: hypothetical protein N0C88_19415 [Candidatus Thiodiazotropha lotti]|uniref:Uncharacterized protein n=1 Tax=Candidatus Thiodiazotropha lotti TaxID=2792787 RepID=A0A9E4N1Z9_9GAMM|nr:hypothetical protein [Candidatus Thiodiazotropha lotti]MCW4205472.1 hypothetical protein [Candidatus Thiodiazotropha lotti]
MMLVRFFLDRVPNGFSRVPSLLNGLTLTRPIFRLLPAHGNSPVDAYTLIPIAETASSYWPGVNHNLGFQHRDQQTTIEFPDQSFKITPDMVPPATNKEWVVD